MRPGADALSGTGGDDPVSRDRRRLIGAAGLAGVAGLIGCSSNSELAAEGAKRPGRVRDVERTVWAVDGVDDLESIVVDRPEAALVRMTPSVTGNGRLRITADDRSSAATHRQAWMIPGTDGFVDGEARTVWWPPSAVLADPVAPQMGLVVRLTATGGAVAMQATGDEGFTSTSVAPWAWARGGQGASSTRGDSHAALVVAPARSPRIVGVARDDSSPPLVAYVVDRVYEFAEGDAFEVDWCSDPSFDGSFVAVAVIPEATSLWPGPAIIVEGRDDRAPVALKPATGRIARPEVGGGLHPAAIYPFHVALRVVGSRITAKRWRVGDVEPTWDDPSWSATIDTADDPVQLPESGGVGVLVDGLHRGAWVEFGDVEIIRY